MLLSEEVIPQIIFTCWHKKKKRIMEVIIMNLVNPVLELSKGSGMNITEVSVS